MGDFNTVLLAGRLVKPLLKTQNEHTFFKGKIQADPTRDEFPIGLSCYVVDKDREAFEKIIKQEEEGPIYACLQNGYESGNIKNVDGEERYMFYDVSTKLSNLTVTKKEPSTPLNQASMRGTVKHSAHDEDMGGQHTIIASSYFSRDPKSGEGLWKERYVRLFVPDQLRIKLTEGKDILVTGKVSEKLGDTWHHHVKVETVMVFE